MKGRLSALRKDLDTLPNIINILLIFPKGHVAFYMGDHALERKKLPNFEGVIGHWLWTEIISEERKHHCRPTS